MEALTAVSVAALTVYDMCKAVDRGMVIDADPAGGEDRGDAAGTIAASEAMGLTAPVTSSAGPGGGVKAGSSADTSGGVGCPRYRCRRPRRPAGRLAAVYAPIAAGAGRGRADLRGRAGQPVPVRAAAGRPLRRLPRQAAAAGAAAADRPGLRRGSRPAHPVLAAVVEMIHTATLVHDDVLDEAVDPPARRHGQRRVGQRDGRPAGRLPLHPRLPPGRLARSTLACR